MKRRDLANLLNRAAAALETPDDLSVTDKQALIDDLISAGALAYASATPFFTEA